MADFATVTELETFMGTTGLGARGTALLGHASALIRGWCGGQDLEETPGRLEEFAGDDDTYTLFLSQRPVTAVSSLTENAVAFTDYEWSRWGTIVRTDETAWATGPILVTYDSGYAAGTDQMAALIAVCLEMTARALGGPQQDTFGAEVPELRGFAAQLFLTEEEKRVLNDFGPVPVG